MSDINFEDMMKQLRHLMSSDDATIDKSDFRSPSLLEDRPTYINVPVVENHKDSGDAKLAEYSFRNN